jgi:hypothetical protein
MTLPCRYPNLHLAHCVRGGRLPQAHLVIRPQLGAAPAHNSTHTTTLYYKDTMLQRSKVACGTRSTDGCAALPCRTSAARTVRVQRSHLRGGFPSPFNAFVGIGPRLLSALAVLNSNGLCGSAAPAVQAVAAPAKPSLRVSGQDVGPKDAPLPSLFPPEPRPPAPVSTLSQATAAPAAPAAAAWLNQHQLQLASQPSTQGHSSMRCSCADVQHAGLGHQCVPRHRTTPAQAP